jgi:alkylhydroperoxidase family enzyme
MPCGAAALAFAGEVALTSREVADDAPPVVHASGFSDAQIFNIVALVAQFWLTNRLLYVLVRIGANVSVIEWRGERSLTLR